MDGERRVKEDSQRVIHSGSLSVKVERPLARAGASGGSSIGRLSRDMMTIAQYAPLCERQHMLFAKVLGGGGW